MSKLPQTVTGREGWELTMRGEADELGRFQIVLSEVAGVLAGRVTCSRALTTGLTLALNWPPMSRAVRVRIVPIPLRTIGAWYVYPIEAYA